MAEWFASEINRFCELGEAQGSEEVLTEIRIKFASLNAGEAAEIARRLDLKRLFVCELTFDNGDLVEQICNVLTLILQATVPEKILGLYSEQIVKSLNHNLPAVRIFALKEVLRVASSSSALPLLMTQLDILNSVIANVAYENLGVAKYAMDTLKKIGQFRQGRQKLFKGVLCQRLLELLSNDVVKFRVYEVVVDIAKHSKENLEECVGLGCLESLISMIEDDDMLLQLNALEILTEFAMTQHGLDFLEEKGVLQQLSQKIAKAHETPLSNLLIPGLMKFFGNVARLCPDEIFTRYPVVISALFEVIESDDQTILAIALDTLGHVSSTVKGKYALESLGNVMPSTLKRIADIIQHMPSEIRVRGLNNLSRILYLEKSEHDNRILSLIKSWFDSMCEEPLKLIVSLCKQPFADIRQASLEVLSVIASQVWGQEYIANHPGLVEFLLDRNCESFKECKEIKFAVVKNLSESVPNVFNAQTMQKFKQFVNEGPFFVHTVTEVAIDGSS